jgi:hypothetical protein
MHDSDVVISHAICVPFVVNPSDKFVLVASATDIA